MQIDIKSFGFRYLFTSNESNIRLGKAQNRGVKYAQTLSATHVII
jgi:hypothetical protein